MYLNVFLLSVKELNYLIENRAVISQEQGFKEIAERLDIDEAEEIIEANTPWSIEMNVSKPSLSNYTLS